MSKKNINKKKIKQKQKQKQTQIVNININKNTTTRKPRERPSQPRRNILPTPQYIYTSPIDSLMPQMFNKHGQRENPSTLTEQINKSLDEKVNKLISQYRKPATIQPTPTQKEVKTTRTEQYNKPNIREKISEYNKNKKPIKYINIFNEQSEDPIQSDQPEQPVDIEDIEKFDAPIPIYKREPETLTHLLSDSYPVKKFRSPFTDLKPKIPSMYKNDKKPITPKIISQSRPKIYKSEPKIYKSEPETLKTIIEKPRTNIKKENLNTISSEYKPKEKLIEKNNNELISDTPLNVVSFKLREKEKYKKEKEKENEENQMMQQEEIKQKITSNNNKIQNIRNTINKLEKLNYKKIMEEHKVIKIGTPDSKKLI